MKKILIILLMILSISLVACSEKYEKIYNLDNVIEIVEVLSEEEVKAYAEECDRVLNTANHITYERILYEKKDPDESNSDSIKEYTTIDKRKFQRNSEMQFIFEYYATGITVGGETKVVSDYKKYGKDGNIYIENVNGSKTYTCKNYSTYYPLLYFEQTMSGAGRLGLVYRLGWTYGIDERGNLICQKNHKWIDDQDSILIEVYNDYKLVYREWRIVEDEQIVSLQKETFSYNWFSTITKKLEGYEHSNFCIASKHVFEE